jgi:hypothetical protein
MPARASAMAAIGTVPLAVEFAPDRLDPVIRADPYLDVFLIFSSFRPRATLSRC